jgi:NAD-dependent dihydropyrimidine dehydrogenase PreA subunit
MIREVIEIEEGKCNGCGNCIPGCPEGALQVIDGKARLVADYLCDGIGACVGECPQDALHVTKKETGKYDEKKVIENIVGYGINTVKAHLKHLRSHGQADYLKTAYEVLKEKNITVKEDETKEAEKTQHDSGGCPGSRMINFLDKKNTTEPEDAQPSQLRQWPVQLHLVSPQAPYFKKADVLLAADCVAYAMGNFHRDYLKGKALIIACPKLDSDMEVYVQKITALADEAGINTLTVMRMQVPCCGGLVQTAKEGLAKAAKKVPLKAITIGLQGEALDEEWL